MRTRTPVPKLSKGHRRRCEGNAKEAAGAIGGKDELRREGRAQQDEGGS